MKLVSSLAMAAMAAAIAAMPAAADPGGKHGARHDDDRGRIVRVADCPPGLAKKNPPCVPPGQARKDAARYGNRIGDILRVGDYVIIRDPGRYDLENRQGWNYYRDDERVYRVDSTTRKVLAILNVIDAFSN